MEATPERSPRRFTLEEYHRMIEVGLFADERLELIRGEIVPMTPHNPPHVGAFTLTAKVLEQAFGPRFHARTRSPLSLDRGSEPEPDVAIVPGDITDYLPDEQVAPLGAPAAKVEVASLMP